MQSQSPRTLFAALGFGLAFGLCLWATPACDSCDDDDCEIDVRTNFHDTSGNNTSGGGTIIIVRTATQGLRLRDTDEPVGAAIVASGVEQGAPATVHLPHWTTTALIERPDGVEVRDVAGNAEWWPGARVRYLPEGSAALQHVDGTLEVLPTEPQPVPARASSRYRVDEARQMVQILDLSGEVLASIPQAFVTFADRDSDLVLTADLPDGRLAVPRHNPHVLYTRR